LNATDITANVEGFMTLEEVAAVMRYAAQAPALAVEIGTYLGLTAAALAAACPHDVYSIDPFETVHLTTPYQPRGFLYEAGNYERTVANLERIGLRERVHLLRRTSLDAAALWRKPIGLLLIDGDHTQASADVAAWSKYVVSGGYLLLHDKYEPDVIAAGEALIASGDWQHIATPNQLLVYKRIGRLPDGTPPPWTDEDTARANAAGPLNITPRPAKQPARKPAARRAKK
jgi:predicted O-methyltransferase YrrM